ncbi:MAG: EamA family transporter [Patescibacteria group bacterium]|nr:EamA family transporter [Patescibacteria group bacterium]
MWLLFATLSAVTAALMTIAGKIGLKNVDPTLATGVRSLFMFLLMAGIVLVGGKLKGLEQIDGKGFYIILISSVFGALSWLFYFLALRTGTASKVAAVDRLSLILVIIISILFLAEKLSLKLALGSIMATIGIVLIALA